MYTELKKRVYEANMELYRRNMVIYTWGNVSEADRERGVFAIKPSGVAYEELKPEDIVVLRIDTLEKVEGKLNPSSDTPTHGRLYTMFENVFGITHTHSANATAWAQAGRSIPCFGTTHADYFRGDIPITRYVSKEETEKAYEYETAKVIYEAFTGKDPIHTPGVLVRGHGPFSFGKNAAASVYNAVVMEEVAKMALITMSINSQAPELPAHIEDKHFLRKHGPNAYYGQGNNG